MTNKTFQDLNRKHTLVWSKDLGIGYFPVDEFNAINGNQPYNQEYWDKYVSYNDTPTGHALTAARVALVKKYTEEEVCDVGIGSGQFVEACKDALGTDINPVAISWLNERGIRWSGYHSMDAMTFWDSIEHIDEPNDILKFVNRYVFISTPIYTDLDHIYRSKHYRKDEHCWYFTENGLKNFMAYFGFDFIEMNRMEEECGREDIGTFVFKRKPRFFKHR